MKAKAIIELWEYWDLTEKQQWEVRSEVASELFSRYRNGHPVPISIDAKIQSIVRDEDEEDAAHPIMLRISNLKEVEEICAEECWYLSNGKRVRPSELEYIVCEETLSGDMK